MFGLFMYIFVYLFIYLFTYLFTYLYICLLIYYSSQPKFRMFHEVLLLCFLKGECDESPGNVIISLTREENGNFTHTNTHTHTHAHTRTHMHAHAHTCTHRHVHRHVHTHMHAHARTHARARTLFYLSSVHGVPTMQFNGRYKPSHASRNF